MRFLGLAKASLLFVCGASSYISGSYQHCLGSFIYAAIQQIFIEHHCVLGTGGGPVTGAVIQLLGTVFHWDVSRSGIWQVVGIRCPRPQMDHILPPPTQGFCFSDPNMTDHTPKLHSQRVVGWALGYKVPCTSRQTSHPAMSVSSSLGLPLPDGSYFL